MKTLMAHSLGPHIQESEIDIDDWCFHDLLRSLTVVQDENVAEENTDVKD